MAKATFNSTLDGVSGRVDDWVFRRVKDKTVIARRPEASRRRPTKAQIAQRDRFRLAGEYAARILADPWQRRVYDAIAAERNRRADKLVMSDFLTPPEVELIELSGYHRRPGDVIRVIATDDVAVVSVRVKIESASGTKIEEGAANEVHGVWIYTATAAAPAGASLRITAIATDRPGHEGAATVSH